MKKTATSVRVPTTTLNDDDRLRLLVVSLINHSTTVNRVGLQRLVPRMSQAQFDRALSAAEQAGYIRRNDHGLYFDTTLGRQFNRGENLLPNLAPKPPKSVPPLSNEEHQVMRAVLQKPATLNEAALSRLLRSMTARNVRRVVTQLLRRKYLATNADGFLIATDEGAGQTRGVGRAYSRSVGDAETTRATKRFKARMEEQVKGAFEMSQELTYAQLDYLKDREGLPDRKAAEHVATVQRSAHLLARRVFDRDMAYAECLRASLLEPTTSPLWSVPEATLLRRVAYLRKDVNLLTLLSMATESLPKDASSRDDAVTLVQRVVRKGGLAPNVAFAAVEAPNATYRITGHGFTFATDGPVESPPPAAAPDELPSGATSPSGPRRLTKDEYLRVATPLFLKHAIPFVMDLVAALAGVAMKPPAGQEIPSQPSPPASVMKRAHLAAERAMAAIPPMVSEQEKQQAAERARQWVIDTWARRGKARPRPTRTSTRKKAVSKGKGG